jgi:enamine deaminase RidA (YjgF/YER057c/UK114 family)
LTIAREGRIEQRLQELGLTLPEPFAPAGHKFNFALVTVHGGLAYIAGHGPFDGTRPLMQGRVGDELTVEQGYDAARLAGLGILASLKQELGALDRVTQWLRAVGYVHAAPGFDQESLVVNGFSDLIVDLWGDAGRHARTSPGLAATPLNVPILIDAIVAVD